MPSRLPRLDTARALRTTTLPRHLDWSTSRDRTYRLAKCDDRARVYRAVLAEGNEGDILASASSVRASAGARIVRAALRGLVRVDRVPWEGRAEDRRRRRLGGHLRAGPGRETPARHRWGVGAGGRRAPPRARCMRAVEGYPITTTTAILEELHVGTVGMFARAGVTEVSRPTPCPCRDAAGALI